MSGTLKKPDIKVKGAVQQPPAQPPVQQPVQESPITTPSKNKYEEFICDNERALLALGFRSQENLSNICTQVQQELFLYPPHRIIFSAMVTLMSQVRKLDLNTLTIRCAELGLNQEAREKYLPLLVMGEFEDSSLDTHVKAVKNAYLKYKLHLILNSGIETVEKNKTPQAEKGADDIIAAVSTDISRLDAYRGLDEDVIPFSDIVESFVLERATNRTDVLGLRTGLESLDRQINGLMDGGVVVIAARKKVGKSAVLANIADYVAYESQQCSVLFLSTEMYSEEDLSRMLALRTFVREREISNGIAWHDPEKKKVLQKAIKQIQTSPCQVYHQYIPNFAIESVVAKAKYWNRKIDNLGLIIFDYIKLPPSRESEQSSYKEHQMLGELTTALKNSVAGEEQIAVLTACQLNRENDVADSDRIARFANTVIFMRPQTPAEFNEHGDFRKYGTHMLEIRDTRAGGQGLIPIRFHKPWLKIVESEPFHTSEEDEEDEESLLSPLEEQKRIDEKYQLPENFSKDQTEMSVGQLLGNTQDLEVEKVMSEQLSLVKKDEK